MKQFRQDLSIEYGRYLRGEITLREYAESTARNDVEVEQIVKSEIHRVVTEVHAAQQAVERRSRKVRALILGVAASLIGGLWWFYFRVLFPVDERTAFEVIDAAILGAVFWALLWSVIHWCLGMTRRRTES